MARGYSKVSSYNTGDVISASLFNNDFNKLEKAFTYSSTDPVNTGHTHDGSAENGAAIAKIGDIDFNNKIEIDGTNNLIKIFIEVGGDTSTEILNVSADGLIPVAAGASLGTVSSPFITANITTVTAETVNSTDVNTSNLTATTAIILEDEALLKFGTSGSEELVLGYAESINSGIVSVGSGEGELQLNGDVVRLTGGINETYLSANLNSGVELYYDNDKTFETVDGGVKVTGTLETTGNVGIGTDSPQAPLHVHGDINLGNSAGADAANVEIASLNFYNRDTSNSAPNNAAIIRAYSSQATGSGGYLTFATSNGTEAEGADATEKMRIASSGNVGINTTSPTELLDVKGNVNVTYGTNPLYITSPLLTSNTFSVAQMADIHYASQLGAVGITPLGSWEDNRRAVQILFNFNGNGTTQFGGWTADDTLQVSNFVTNNYSPSDVSTFQSYLQDMLSGTYSFQTTIIDDILDGDYDYLVDYKVGINAAPATEALEVGGNIKASGFDSSILLSSSVSNNQIISRGSDSATGRDLAFVQGTSESMRIDSSGNIGMGAINPTDKLHVKDGAIRIESIFPKLYLTDSDHDSDYSIVNNQGNFGIYDETNGAFRFVIDPTGQVAIGAISPTKQLTVLAPDTSQQIELGRTGTSTGAGIIGADATDAFGIWGNSGQDKLVSVLHGGNVGIGTTSPTSLLHLKSSSAPTLKIDDLDSTYALELAQNDVNGSVLLKSAGTLTIGVDHDSADAVVVFQTRNDERMRITSVGRVGIGTTDPASDSKLNVDGGDIVISNSSSTNHPAILFYDNDDTQVMSESPINAGIVYNDSATDDKNIYLGLSVWEEFDASTMTNLWGMVNKKDVTTLNITKGKKVGVNTNTPSAELDVVGKIAVGTSTGIATPESLVSLRLTPEQVHNWINEILHVGVHGETVAGTTINASHSYYHIFNLDTSNNNVNSADAVAPIVDSIARIHWTDADQQRYDDYTDGTLTNTSTFIEDVISGKYDYSTRNIILDAPSSGSIIAKGDISSEGTLDSDKLSVNKKLSWRELLTPDITPAQLHNYSVNILNASLNTLTVPDKYFNIFDINGDGNITSTDVAYVTTFIDTPSYFTQAEKDEYNDYADGTLTNNSTFIQDVFDGAYDNRNKKGLVVDKEAANLVTIEGDVQAISLTASTVDGASLTFSEGDVSSLTTNSSDISNAETIGNKLTVRGYPTIDDLLTTDRTVKELANWNLEILNVNVYGSTTGGTTIDSSHGYWGFFGGLSGTGVGSGDSLRISIFVGDNYTQSEQDEYDDYIDGTLTNDSTFVEDVLNGDYDSQAKAVVIDKDASNLVTVQGNVHANKVLTPLVDADTVEARDIIVYESQAAAVSPLLTTDRTPEELADLFFTALRVSVGIPILKDYQETLVDFSGSGDITTADPAAVSAFIQDSNNNYTATEQSDYSTYINTDPYVYQSTIILDMQRGDYDYLIAPAKVGINTETPASALDVIGDISVSGNITSDLGLNFTPTNGIEMRAGNANGIEMHWWTQSADASALSSEQTKRFHITQRGVHVGDDVTGTYTAGDNQDNQDIDFGMLIGRNSENFGSNNVGIGFNLAFPVNSASNFAQGSIIDFYGATQNCAAFGGNLDVGLITNTVGLEHSFIGGHVAKTNANETFTWATGAVDGSTGAHYPAVNNGTGSVLFGRQGQIDVDSTYSLLGGRVGPATDFIEPSLINSSYAFSWGRGNVVDNSNASVVCGDLNSVDGAANALVAGESNTVLSSNAFVAGSGNETTSVDAATAIGKDNIAEGNYSVAIGKDNISLGEAGVCLGQGLKTSIFNQSVTNDPAGPYQWDNYTTVVGGYNDPSYKYLTDHTGSTTWVDNHRFVVGTGLSDFAKQNGFIVAIPTSDFSGIIMPALAASTSHANDTAAKAAGVPVGGLYHTNGVVKVVL